MWLLAVAAGTKYNVSFVLFSFRCRIPATLRLGYWRKGIRALNFPPTYTLMYQFIMKVLPDFCIIAASGCMCISHNSFLVHLYTLLSRYISLSLYLIPATLCLGYWQKGIRAPNYLPVYTQMYPFIMKVLPDSCIVAASGCGYVSRSSFLVHLHCSVDISQIYPIPTFACRATSPCLFTSHTHDT